MFLQMELVPRITQFRSSHPPLHALLRHNEYNFQKFFELITLDFPVLVLLDPLKSADPPISSGRASEIISIILEEHCLVAIFGFD